MDNLEKFITENREKLDRYKPRRVIWKRVRAGSGIASAGTGWKVAAAALIALLAGISALFYYAGTGKAEYKTGNRELAETGMFYTQQINNLYRTVSPMLAKEPDLEKELNADMSLLDSIFTDIKKDLKDNISNREVIEALIRNYRQRVMILEEMLLILDEKQTENEKNNQQNL